MSVITILPPDRDYPRYCRQWDEVFANEDEAIKACLQCVGPRRAYCRGLEYGTGH